MSKNLLLGSYGRGNVGDDLFLIIMTYYLKNDVTFNSAHDDLLPTELERENSTISTLHNRDFIRKVSAFIKAKNIIYGGGDLWVKLYGNKFPNRTLLKMLFINIISKLVFKKIYYIGCGAGNLDGLALLIARISAQLADQIIVRDYETLKILNVKGEVMPDLTITLPRKNGTYSIRNNKFKLGISLMYDVPNPEENFVKIIEAVKKYISIYDPKDIEIILIPMFKTPYYSRDDYWASKIFANQVPDYTVNILEFDKHTELIDVLKTCNLLISTRLHASILATWNNVPVVGIAYRPKVTRFFKQYSLGSLAIAIDDLEKLNDTIDLALQKNTIREIRSNLIAIDHNRAKYEKILFNIT